MTCGSALRRSRSSPSRRFSSVRSRSATSSAACSIAPIFATQGSGNIGAMNALRTLGKAGGAAVLLLDALKGFVPVILFAAAVFPRAGVAAKRSSPRRAVLGHCFSPWLRLARRQGRRDVLRCDFRDSWPAGLVAVGGWIAGALLTQIFVGRLDAGQRAGAGRAVVFHRLARADAATAFSRRSSSSTRTAKISRVCEPAPKTPSASSNG